MRVEALKLTGVRNLLPLVLEPGPRFNVLSGDNGQGKTNLLEAIYVLCALRSFRTARLGELVAFDADQAELSARVAGEGFTRRLDVVLRSRGKTVRIDGKVPRPISRYFGHFNAVLFAPEDLRTPKASPSDRRKFLDRALFSYKPEYLATAQAYDKAVKTRNALLRKLAGRLGTSADLLEVYDAQVADLGTQVILERRAFVERLRPHLLRGFEAIAEPGLSADVVYRSAEELSTTLTAADLGKALVALLVAARPRDLARETTSVGPHRDDLEFLFQGRSAARFASQGQLRALVLAWKTAELDLLGEAHSSAPVLLLDDVSSELDRSRNEQLFAFLRTRPNQCFITSTHSDYVLLDRDRVDFRVAAGRVSPV